MIFFAMNFHQISTQKNENRHIFTIGSNRLTTTIQKGFIKPLLADLHYCQIWLGFVINDLLVWQHPKITFKKQKTKTHKSLFSLLFYFSPQNLI
jgi:hypothetical protein